MNYTDSENADICMNALVKAVGLVDEERFIAYMNREAGDYTIARHAMFDDMSAEELDREIHKFEEANPGLIKLQHYLRPGRAAGHESFLKIAYF